MNITYSGNLVINSYRIPFSRSLNMTLEYYSKLKKILRIKRAKNVEFIRVGRQNDGGYVMADSFLMGGGYSVFFWNI